MEGIEKVCFTIGIYRGEEYHQHEEEFTLEELGYQKEIHAIDDFLDSLWRDWRNEKIHGGWHFKN